MEILSYTGIRVMQAIAAGGRYGFEIMERTGLPSGTVYPLLRRFDARGLVESDWECDSESKAAGRPPRRYYQLTPEGKTALAMSLEQMRALVGSALPTT